MGVMGVMGVKGVRSGAGVRWLIFIEEIRNVQYFSNT
jgi:hypothetical protein